MKEFETLKVYGKTINRWRAWDEAKGKEVTTQIEVEYREYDSNGNLIGCGTEDFSLDRWNSQMAEYRVWTWDGSHYNKGGHKYWECPGISFRISTKDKRKAKHIAAIWEARRNPVEIDLRK